MKYALNTFIIQNNLADDIEISVINMQKLKIECELAKIKLSNIDCEYTNLFVEKFCNDIDLKMTIDINKFNEICNDLFLLCMKPVEELLQISNTNIDDIKDIVMVGGVSRMRGICENLQSFFKKSLNNSVNPDEVVSMGAALQGFIIANPYSDLSQSITIMNTTSLSLGVDIMDGIYDILIPRNTTLPYTKKKTYTTKDDDVTTINIAIYQGERKLTKDNIKIGEFLLEGIEEKPRGIPRIEIIFHIDINNILLVTAEDKNNKNNVQSITIKNLVHSCDNIDQLIEESTLFNQYDNLNREIIEFEYKINDICELIITNIDQVDNMLDTIKNDIKTDLTNIKLRLSMVQKIKESNSQELLNEYVELLNYINSTYTIFIYERNDAQIMTLTNQEFVNICNDCNEKQCNNQVEFNKKNTNNNNIIKELTPLDIIKKELSLLCNQIADTIDYYNNKQLILDLINDILLWMYVTEDIKEADIAQRKQELILITQDNKKQDVDSKNILEELIYTLLSNENIDNDKNLQIKLNQILEEIIEEDVKISLGYQIINPVNYNAYIEELKNIKI